MPCPRLGVAVPSFHFIKARLPTPPLCSSCLSLPNISRKRRNYTTGIYSLCSGGRKGGCHGVVAVVILTDSALFLGILSVSFKITHAISPQESSLPLSDVIACPFSVSDHQLVLVNKMSNCQMNLGDTINQNQFHVDEVQVHHHNEQHVYQHHPRVTNNTVYNINNTYIVTGDQSTSLKAIEGMALGQGALLVLHVVNCFPVA